MAGGIEVDPGEIARRGRAMVAAGAAADQVVGVARRLSLIVAAMPHSRSALAAAGLEQQWAHVTSAWAEAARKHGAALSMGGCDYEGTERAVRHTLGQREPQLPTSGPLEKRGVL